MSKKQEQSIVQEDEPDDVEPEELIDTQENKPKVTPEYRELEYKNVGKLTDEEKDYLINLYKNGGEHDLYKVRFYKNGTNKITRKKQPPKYNTTKRLLEQEQLKEIRSRQNTAPMLTNEQILMEHVIDLEAKYAMLYQKHKKLKKRTKELQEDLYVDENDDNKPLTKKKKAEPQQQETEYVQQEVEQQQQPCYTQPAYNVDQDNYINRLRRPQKGYRRMMAGVLN